MTRPHDHPVPGVSESAVAAVPRKPNSGRAQVIGASDRSPAETDRRRRLASGRPERRRPPAPGVLQHVTDQAQHLPGPARTVGVAHRERDVPEVGLTCTNPLAASVSPSGFHRATRGSVTYAKHGLDRVPPDRGRWQRESGSGSSECSNFSDATTSGRSSAWPAESHAALTSGTPTLLEPRGHTPALGRSSASQRGLSSTKSSAVSSARLP